MGINIGAKGGKRDLKLMIQNKKRKKKKQIEEMRNKQKEKEQEIQKKKEEMIITPKSQQDPTNTHQSKLKASEKEMPKQCNSQEENFLTNSYIKEKRINLQQEQQELKEKEQVNQELEENTIQTLPNSENEKENKISIFDCPQESKPKYRKKTKGKQTDNYDKQNTKKQIDILNEKKEENIFFLEQQVIKVLEQQLEEKKYSLKKIDSEVYAIQQSTDSITEEKELLTLEQEISELIDRIEEMKRQIVALERTLGFRFPIESPDNYLIYLVEEYKNNRKEEIDLEKAFLENKKYQTLVDTMIIIEKKQEAIQKQLEEKRKQMNLEEEQVQKLQENMINIEEMDQKIEKMLVQSKKVLEEITNKVNETVHITEKVDYVTRQINHSLFELFLLMNLFKRNLSIKNSAVTAISTAIILDMILKITTPIEEKKISKVIKMEDYKNMINHCLSDTDFLVNTIHQNLNQISTLRYTLEHDYSSCSYLPSYQETLRRLSDLEEKMEEHRKNILVMKIDMEHQLEKNNAKVKKYASIKSADF